MQRSIVLTVVALTTLLGAGPSLSATPNKAKALALRACDFPKGTVAKHPSGESNASYSGYTANYHYRTAGRPNELTVTVLVFKGAAMAKATYAELSSDLGPEVPKLKLPSFGGDKQVANFSVIGGSQLVVLKGSVVWAFNLQTFLTRGGQTHELTKAEAIAEYMRYGKRQQNLIAGAKPCKG